MTSGKLGQSKTSTKIHANESSMHSGSSKHMQPSRELSQKYVSGDKSQSSQALQMSKHSSQSHQFNNSYLGSGQHHH